MRRHVNEGYNRCINAATALGAVKFFYLSSHCDFVPCGVYGGLTACQRGWGEGESQRRSQNLSLGVGITGESSSRIGVECKPTGPRTQAHGTKTALDTHERATAQRPARSRREHQDPLA